MDSSALHEIIKANIHVLNDIESADPITDAKEIVCKFYKGGSHPNCKFCAQKEETVNECKDVYLKKIEVRPLEVWTEAFDAVEVREKKKIVSTLNTLKCDSCYLKDSCPEYKSMSTCAIDFGEGINTAEPKEMLDVIIRLQHERIQIARAAELADGGIPDQNLSNEMDRLSGLIATKNDLLQDKFSLKIEATQQANSGKPSILQQLFGGGATQSTLPEETTKTIDITKASTIEFTEEKLEEKVPVRRRGQKPKDE